MCCLRAYCLDEVSPRKIYVNHRVGPLLLCYSVISHQVSSHHNNNNFCWSQLLSPYLNGGLVEILYQHLVEETCTILFTPVCFKTDSTSPCPLLWNTGAVTQWTVSCPVDSHPVDSQTVTQWTVIQSPSGQSDSHPVDSQSPSGQSDSRPVDSQAVAQWTVRQSPSGQLDSRPVDSQSSSGQSDSRPVDSQTVAQWTVIQSPSGQSVVQWTVSRPVDSQTVAQWTVAKGSITSEAGK